MKLRTGAPPLPPSSSARVVQEENPFSSEANNINAFCGASWPIGLKSPVRAPNEHTPGAARSLGGRRSRSMRVRRSSSPSTPKIGLPLVEPIQRIMIRAEAFWQTVPANRSAEHAAQRHTINGAAMDAKTDATPRKLVHHHENQMGSQRGRFASEQIAIPQTVLHMAEKRKPGKPLGSVSGR